MGDSESRMWLLREEMIPAKRRKDAYLRRMTLLPIATVLLTSVALAFRGSMSGHSTEPGFDLARGGGKPPHCDPSAPSVEFGSPEFWWRLAVSGVLVLVGGLFAGLTLGELWDVSTLQEPEAE